MPRLVKYDFYGRTYKNHAGFLTWGTVYYFRPFQVSVYNFVSVVAIFCCLLTNIALVATAAFRPLRLLPSRGRIDESDVTAD